MASGTMHKEQRLVYHEATFTSGSDGLIATGISSSVPVFNIYANGYPVFPLIYQGQWIFMLAFSDGTYLKPLKNQTVNVAYYTLN